LGTPPTRPTDRVGIGRTWRGNGRSMMRRTPQIYVEAHDDAWAVQELDKPPAARRFRNKVAAEAAARAQAARRAAELIVLDIDGSIERWEPVRRPPAR